MTISTENRKMGPFEGNDTATSFAFTFKVFEASDLQLTLTDADGNDIVLTLDSDYSVTLNSDQETNPGGSVTYPITGDPLATGELLTGVGVLPELQSASIENLGGFYPKVIENALDKCVVLIQQLAEKLGRAVVISVGSSLTDIKLPSPGADEFLKWNSAGTALETATVQPGSSVTDASETIKGIAEIATQTETNTGTNDTKIVTPKKVAATLTNWYETAKNFLANGTSAAARTIRDKLRDFVSALDFALGDGTTDDSDALQAAIDSLGPDGGEIIFPAKSYKIGSALTITKSHVTLNFANGARLKLPASANGIELSGSIENVKIKGAYFDGDTDSVAIHGIGINDALTVEGCYFNGGAKGIYLVSGSSSTGAYGSHIRGCVFNAQTVKSVHVAPVTVGFAQAHFISDCAFFGNVQDLYATSGSGIFVHHCRFERIAALTGSVAKIHVDTCNKFVLRDNYIEEGHNAVACLEIGSAVDNLICEGNYFTLGDDGTTDGVEAVSQTAAASNVVFDGNYISHAGTTTTLVDFGAATHVRAHNNTIAAGTLTNAFKTTANQVLVDIANNKYSGTITNKVNGIIEGSMRAAAWAVYNGNSTSLNQAFNVASVTRNAAGDYSFNFQHAMTSANYAVVVSGKAPSNGTNVCVATVISQTADAVRVNIAATGGGTGGLADSSLVNLVVFGPVS